MSLSNVKSYMSNVRRGGCLCTMAIVKAQPGDTNDTLIRKFSKKVLQEGILNELKEREFYKSPSVRRQERNKLRSRKRPMAR